MISIRNLLSVSAALLLIACGGGGGSAGTPALGPGSGTPSTGGTGTTAAASITVTVSSNVITPATPATLSVTVRSATGNPVSGQLVDLTMLHGSLAVLSVPSVNTDANGTATTNLSAAPAGLSGADQVVAVAKLGTTTIQGSVSFTVTGSSPTLSLSASSTTLRQSTSPVTIRALMRDAAGNVLANQLVKFASTNGLVQLGAATAQTDGFGVATVTARPVNASISAAESIVATANYALTALQSNLIVQIIGESPSLLLTLSNSNVTATTPSTLSVLVKDASGAAVTAGTVVTVASSFGLTTFDATSALTDATGVAKIVISPKAAASNGADQIVASATLAGVSTTASTVVQVSAATSSTGTPVLQTTLSSTSINSASPAILTATLTDAKGAAVSGQVVTFAVVRGLGRTNVGTALTDSTGKAVVILSPTNSTVSGADEVTASASFAGAQLQSTKGFQVQATNVTLATFTSAVTPLAAYGQTTLTVGLTGASVGSPVNVSITSSCVDLGKATLSPSTFTATAATVSLQYKDNGCGALQIEDKLTAAITGGTSSIALQLPIQQPAEASIAFISASPEVIYLKGNGVVNSTLTFEVRDRASNPLPGRKVNFALLTQIGGITIEDGTGPVSQVSNASGRVSVRVNSGTVPTPIRVSAALDATPTIATVSSNLSIAVGLPSQMNFSMSQTTLNIEGFNVDGTENFYNVIASDRNGNPVPAGTSINFVTEGGQVEPSQNIQLVSGIARTSSRFVSADPRPADGRITVTAFTLGEESFIDQNGNNTYDLGEPFQDLGNIYRDRIFDGIFDPTVDETLGTGINNGTACVAAAAASGATPTTTALLALDGSIPSVAGTCDGKWSGSGQVYVRRSVETVLSTSSARPLWANINGLDPLCLVPITLQNGPKPSTVGLYPLVTGSETWYTQAKTFSLSFLVADANTFSPLNAGFAAGRLNPMAAGTIVSVTASSGLSATMGGGSPVPSTTEANYAVAVIDFGTVSSGVVSVNFKSPGGLTTSYSINVVRNADGLPPIPGACH
jgi:hypothetical protein